MDVNYILLPLQFYAFSYFILSVYIYETSAIQWDESTDCDDIL